MDIAEIIIKKLNNQLSATENEIFRDWLESSLENKELFERLEQSKLKTGNVPNIDHLDPSAVLNKLLLSSKTKRKKRLVFSVMKYASVGIIFIVGGYSIWQYSKPVNIPQIIDPYAVTLDMGDGKIISLSAQNQQDIIDDSGNVIGKSTQKEIDYTNATKQNEVAYNYLKVPNGKTYNVRLSDGTLVHMNAGSSLKYPAAFSAESFRKVTLSGEAFFEVSKDKKHPFVISVNRLDITVLGTKFNVSSYPEDISIKTVLVEGSVKLAEKGTKAQFLTPGHEAEWNPNSKKIKFSKVDTSIATRWMEKGLVISQLPFDKMANKLERYYGVTIENRNKTIKDEVFTAEFANETIEEVLNVFQDVTEFKYKIENKHIIIY
jgi:transmembrane sensor